MIKAAFRLWREFDLLEVKLNWIFYAS